MLEAAYVDHAVDIVGRLGVGKCLVRSCLLQAVGVLYNNYSKYKHCSYKQDAYRDLALPSCRGGVSEQAEDRV